MQQFHFVHIDYHWVDRSGILMARHRHPIIKKKHGQMNETNKTKTFLFGEMCFVHTSHVSMPSTPPAHMNDPSKRNFSVNRDACNSVWHRVNSTMPNGTFFIMTLYLPAWPKISLPVENEEEIHWKEKMNKVKCKHLRKRVPTPSTCKAFLLIGYKSGRWQTNRANMTIHLEWIL